MTLERLFLAPGGSLTAHREQSDRFAHAMSAATRPTGLILGTILAILLIASLQFAFIALQLLLPPDVVQDGGLVLASFCFLPIWAVLWVWLRLKEGRPFATIGFSQRAHAPFLLLRGAGIAFAAMTLIVGIGVLTGNLAFRANADGTLIDWSSLGWVIVAILAFAIQGGAEELTTRGYLFQVWFRRTGLIGSVIAQTVFFTLVHGANTGFSILPAVSLVAVAVLLCFWALAEGGLWGPLAFHGIWNWSQGLFFGISVSGNEISHSLFHVAATEGSSPAVSGGDFGAEGSAVTCVVLALLAGVAIAAFVRVRRASVVRSAA